MMKVKKLGLFSLLLIAGTMASLVVSNGSSVATVITSVGVFFGVGIISSGVAAAILAVLKKQGKAKAAAF
ncbi:uberolysin/carnocyclin family circular bacteriocin [Bacillus pumilus]|uniref:Circular bacteriocin, circularin A/uberolysin family n=2 Tax=Bacillus pumilus TaxID=1408 RepID=A0AAD0MMJ8_BACPU|nr:uberolysin/carnocyclin family circular bacteriocin [Bacillus pumilus]AVM25754.1 hypothetical protein C5695_18630 [Bacillus pumilus]TYS41778.1 hypothetical protein FZC68_12870 [Bacillus pumilus]